MSARAFHLDLLGDPMPRESSAKPNDLAAQIKRQGAVVAVSMRLDGAKVRVTSIEAGIALARQRANESSVRFCLYVAAAGQQRPAWHLAATIDPGQPIDLTMLGSLLA